MVAGRDRTDQATGGISGTVADGGRRPFPGARGAHVAAGQCAEVNGCENRASPLAFQKKQVHTADRWSSSGIGAGRSARTTSFIYARWSSGIRTKAAARYKGCR